MKKTLVLLLLAAAAAPACRKKPPAPEVVMIPSHAESPDAAALPSPSAAISRGAVTVAGISFTPARDWISETPSSSMRAAQYSLPGKGGGGPASLVVYYFGKGQGGSVAENVARWEGQFADASGQMAQGRVATLTENGLPVTTVTASGTYSSGVPMGGPEAPQPGFSLWGAIVEGAQGNVFLKVTGPAATVSAWGTELEKLLTTIRPGSTSM